MVSIVHDAVVNAALVATAADCGPFAPFDPALRLAELRDRLQRVRASTIVVTDPDQPHVRDLVDEFDLGLVCITRHDAGLGEASVLRRAVAAQAPHPSNPALILQTGGTSGTSTLVGLSHPQLDASLANMAAAFEMGPADRSLAVLPLFHVHGIVAGVLLPLSVGGSVACPKLYDATAFLGWLTEFEPTYYTAVPTVHASVLARARAHPDELGEHRLRFVRSTGAALDPEVAAGLEATLDVPVLAGYAMTETASQITSNRPGDQRRLDTVGTSVGPDVRVADDDGVAVAPGTSGRVMLRGSSVITQYLDDPDTDAERFRDGWLLTGDIGVLDTDGHLRLVGRSGDVIRRGGASVQPREVEMTLRGHAAVADAVVFGVPDERLGEQVAAAVVTSEPTSEAALRQYVFEHRLPAEVPRRILLVDQLLTEPSGKVRRRGLAEHYGLADLDRATDRPAPRPPRNDTEKRLADLWSDVLATPVSDVHADFFGLGGDSLRIKALLEAVEPAFGVDVPFIRFFDALTIADQAELVQNSPALSRPPEVTPRSHNEPFALSRAQERLWILEQLEPGKPDYHIPWWIRIDGPLDVARLQRAIEAVVQRHAPLRTLIEPHRGEPRQRVLTHVNVALERRPATGVLLDELRSHLDAPFDLANDIPIRSCLIDDGDSVVLAIAMHHMAADGLSIRHLGTDLSNAYNHDRPLPVLGHSYADYVEWERARALGDRYQADLDAWHDLLTPPPTAAALPWDRQPDAAIGGPAHAIDLDLADMDPPLLRTACRETRATPFMVLLSGLARSMAMLGDGDVVMGTPREDRSWGPAAPMIGYFVNTLPLRFDLRGRPTATEAVQRVRAAALHAYQIGDVAFDDIVARVNPPRDPSRNPLFDVMFTAPTGARSVVELDGLSVEPIQLPAQHVKFPMEVDVRVTDTQLIGSLSCDTRWFDPRTAADLAGLVEDMMYATVRAAARAATG